MTEREKAQKGYLYDANYDPEIIEEDHDALICVMNSISVDHPIQKNRKNC